MCMSDYRRGFGLDIGFIDNLQVVTTNNCNTIADFHTLQITDTHSLMSSIYYTRLAVSWQQILTQAL
jgi:hypothetical protein